MLLGVVAFQSFLSPGACHVGGRDRPCHPNRLLQRGRCFHIEKIDNVNI